MHGGHAFIFDLLTLIDRSFTKFELLTSNSNPKKKKDSYPVLRDAGLLVRVVTLDHRVVAGGGAGGEALLRLVARGAVRRLVGVEGGRGVFLVQDGDGGQQILHQAEDLHSSLGEGRKEGPQN